MIKQGRVWTRACRGGCGEKALPVNGRADAGSGESPCSQHLECLKWAGIHSLFASAKISGSRSVCRHNGNVNRGKMYSFTGVGRELNINAQNRCSAAVSLSQLNGAWLPKGACIQDVKSDLPDCSCWEDPPVRGKSTETARVSTWEAQILTKERKPPHSISLGLYVGRKRKGQFCKARFFSFSWAVLGASP